MFPKSNFAKQTWFLVPALLLTTVPFWSFIINDIHISSPELIFWYSFVMLIPIAVTFLLIIRRRLNNGENILLVSKSLRILTYLIISVFGVMFIADIFAMYDLGFNAMLHAVDDMPIYILSGFIANILIISLLCFSIRYNKLMCGLDHFKK